MPSALMYFQKEDVQTTLVSVYREHFKNQKGQKDPDSIRFNEALKELNSNKVYYDFNGTMKNTHSFNDLKEFSNTYDFRKMVECEMIYAVGTGEIKKVEDVILANQQEYKRMNDELKENKPIKLAEIEEIKNTVLHNNPHVEKRN
jgi:hypothetical protein